MCSLGGATQLPPNLCSFCTRDQKWIVAQIRVRDSDGCTFLCGDDGVIPCVLIDPDPKIKDAICVVNHWNAVYDSVRRQTPLRERPTYLEIWDYHVLLARQPVHTAVSSPSLDILGNIQTPIDLTSESATPTASTSHSLATTCARTSIPAHSVSRLYHIERQVESVPSAARVRPHIDITGQVVAVSTIFRSSTQPPSIRSKRDRTSGKKTGANVFFLVELQQRLGLSSRVVVRLLFHQKQVRNSVLTKFAVLSSWQRLFKPLPLVWYIGQDMNRVCTHKQSAHKQAHTHTATHADMHEEFNFFTNAKGKLASVFPCRPIRGVHCNGQEKNYWQ